MSETSNERIGHQPMVDRLESGESYVMSRREPLDRLTTARAQEITNKLRGQANAIVGRAKTKTGNSYQIENGEFLVRDKSLMLCVVITRTEDDGDEDFGL